MRVVSINAVPYGSTAGVMLGIMRAAEASGMETHAFVGYSNHPHADIAKHNVIHGNALDKLVHILLGRFTGLNGCFSHYMTARLIKTLDCCPPDIIHLHNLHGWYINLPMLFRYIKKHNIPVVWTLHDCWPFTGHCSHFTFAKCDKWKTGCHHCPQYREYPQSLVDNSRIMYAFKKKWFTGVKNMTIVTPSQWLADLVKESFLKDYPVKVIHNGIDLEVFKPTPSDFRQRYGIPADKHILLGVAFGWGVRKGLDVFVELAKRLDSNRYQIVLVGTDDATDRQLPDSIISIHRTMDQTELAQIYTAADLFVNPTREENYPTVNMEAIACGTPVLTFRTGGSPEIVDDTCGSVVDCDDVDALEQEIRWICGSSPYTKEACCAKAVQFDKNRRYQEYLELYDVM